MTIVYNTSLVRDGLVMYLDAANVKSYPGSGTSWNDLSGNNKNGTLTNSPTYSTNGYLQFNGVNNYVSITNSTQYLEYTFILFCKWLTSTGSNRPFGLPSYGTYTIINFNDIGYHFNPLDGLNPSTTLSSGFAAGLNNWVQIVVSESRENNVSNIYINGIKRNSFSRVSTSGIINSILLGAQKPAEAGANCQISTFSLYNRLLSDTEISKNFQAFRGRYGI